MAQPGGAIAVTGASRGIGAMVALELASRGFTVACLTRCLAVAWAGKGIRVLDVARLVAAVFAEDIPFLTGETIYLDGGQGIAH